MWYNLISKFANEKELFPIIYEYVWQKFTSGNNLFISTMLPLIDIVVQPADRNMLFSAKFLERNTRATVKKIKEDYPILPKSTSVYSLYCYHS